MGNLTATLVKDLTYEKAIKLVRDKAQEQRKKQGKAPKADYTDLKERTAPVRLADGGGLYIQITKQEQKAWVLRFTRHGKTREMGLGAYVADDRKSVSLAAARIAAADAWRQVREGVDPIEARDKTATDRRTAEQQSAEHTFRIAAEGCIKVQEKAWKGDGQSKAWRAGFENHVYPRLGDTDVAKIVVNDIVAVLKPIWHSIPTTAGRIRTRIEAVISYAGAPSRQWRTGENPARWDDVLEHELAQHPSRDERVEHHPSLPWVQVPAFIAALDDQQPGGNSRPNVTAYAEEFNILTASRILMIGKAVWPEIDLDTATWIIPAAKMKTKHDLRIPLSKAALAVLAKVRPLALSPKGLIFPTVEGSYQRGRNFKMLLEKMSPTDDGQLPRWRDEKNRAAVSHGFRTSFKAWARPRYQDFLSEIAMAHAEPNKVKGAYAREDLLEERRPMMEAWGRICRPIAATVGLGGL